MEARGKRAAFSKVRWARSVCPRRRQLPQGPSVCDKIAASSDCSRPVNDYVHIEAADLCRPNARFTPERQGYQVLTPFGKLGYSQKIMWFGFDSRRLTHRLSAAFVCTVSPGFYCDGHGLNLRGDPSGARRWGAHNGCQSTSSTVCPLSMASERKPSSQLHPQLLTNAEGASAHFFDSVDEWRAGGEWLQRRDAHRPSEV